MGRKTTVFRNGHLLTAKGISSQFKLSYPTINYYTDLGFFTVIKREGNQRFYNRQQIKNRVHQIAELMNEGYPLRLIRKHILAEGVPSR